MPPVLIEDIETPALIVDLDVMESNIRKMSEFMKNKKAKLRPHFKTHKCPAIAHMQMAAGAKGITCAKLSEAEVLAAAGVRDILIANQVVEAPKIYRLAALAKNARVTVCVDNLQNVAKLSEAAAAYSSTIYALIEVDVGMKRCGINTKEEAFGLAERILASGNLAFEGIQAYAGQLSHLASFNDRVDGFRAVNEKVSGIKRYLESAGMDVKEISGASTGTYNITGDDTIWTEIQAGSYVFMDLSYDALGLEFDKSLSVLSTVIHKRSGAAVADAGLKACGTDQGPPSIKRHPGLDIALKEEHAIIMDARDELKYLDKIEYDPAHCCSTVNLFDTYHCVRGGRLEAIWPVSGRGKCQ